MAIRQQMDAGKFDSFWIFQILYFTIDKPTVSEELALLSKPVKVLMNE